MLFNNDLLFVTAASIFIVGGVILTYSFYNDIFPTVNKGESLVNTNSISKLDSNIQLDNLPNPEYVDAVVQTEVIIQVETSIQAANTYVNTGMQTSSRMWLQTIKNWIDNILSTPNPNPQGASGHSGQYVDIGVQTNGPSLSIWVQLKQWFLDIYSIRSSELSSIGFNKVSKWRNKLDSDQSVDLHNSDSPLTTLKFGSDSELQNLVDPNDSASNISEIVFEGPERVYDMSNVADVLDLMNDPTVVFSINFATLRGDDLITFYTADTSNEILRSTLEALITSVN
jgi:hypothetical protein